MSVHPTAILEGDIELGDDVEIGPNCVLQGEITIGPRTRLLGSAYLHGPLTIGSDNRIYPFVCLGFAPQHTKFDPSTPGRGIAIGDHNIFREGVTVHRAFSEDGPTSIGDHNYFMTNQHVGHDCHIGSHCTLVTASAFGGHCEVADRVTVGGNASIHQFCRLGRGSMMSGGMGLSADLPPWFMLTGDNVVGAVNLIGLRRNGFSREQIDTVRWVYRTLYRRNLSLASATEALRERSDEPLVAEYIAFIESSKRGIATARAKAARGSG